MFIPKGYDVITPNDNNNKNTQEEIAARRNVTSSSVNYIYYVYVISHRYIVCVRVPISSTCLYREGEKE